MCKEIYCKELAYISVEAKKSHHLASASWRPRKASGVVQFKAEGLRTRGIDGVSSSPSPEA